MVPVNPGFGIRMESVYGSGVPRTLATQIKQDWPLVDGKPVGGPARMVTVRIREKCDACGGSWLFERDVLLHETPHKLPPTFEVHIEAVCACGAPIDYTGEHSIPLT